MSTTTSPEDEAPVGSRIALASHLVRCALGTSSPRTGSQYRQALDTWQTNAEFREMVRDVASGMGLVVADVNGFGMALAAQPDSAFAPLATRLHNAYSNRSSGRAFSALEARAVLGLALMTTAVLAFPDEAALDGNGTSPAPVHAREVRERMEALAKASRDEAESHDGTEDGEDEREGSLRRMFDAVLACPPLRLTARGNQKEGTLAWHVMKAFEALQDHGHAHLQKGGEDEEETGASIIPKDRWRKLLRHHAAAETHAAVRRAMAALPPAPIFLDATQPVSASASADELP